MPASPLRVERHRRRVDCDVAAPALPAMAGGDSKGERRIREHVGECLRCQAELARYRRLIRTLKSLHGEDVMPPVDALPALLAEMEASGTAGLGRAAIVGAYISGVAVATAAAGVLVWRSRRRLAG